MSTGSLDVSYNDFRVYVCEGDDLALNTTQVDTPLKKNVLCWMQIFQF